jgi:hypothetical protein
MDSGGVVEGAHVLYSLQHALCKLQHRMHSTLWIPGGHPELRESHFRDRLKAGRQRLLALCDLLHATNTSSTDTYRTFVCLYSCMLVYFGLPKHMAWGCPSE